MSREAAQKLAWMARLVLCFSRQFLQTWLTPYLTVKHALIVEDDSAFERLLHRSIAALAGNWFSHACQTGPEAIELLNTATQLDLALVDLGLPYVSGIEVIQAAHARFPELPIIVVSVISSESSVLAAIQAGASGYVLKDDNELSIAHAISQILNGVYPISSSLAKYLFRLASPSANPANMPLLGALSPKEQEVLQHLSSGYSYAETAKLMGVALSTVQHHIRNLYRKLDVRSQTQAISKARATGLL
jgi:DNA-binding NarL/FixJ family response regulator